MPAAAPAATARALIADRRRRDQFFPAELFADPAWDMLLDLYAACREGRRVSVSSLCIAAAVPGTTALRWIGVLEDCGLVQDEPDVADRRRRFVGLTDAAFQAVAAYLATIEAKAEAAQFPALSATTFLSQTPPISDADLLVTLARRLGMAI